MDSLTELATLIERYAATDGMHATALPQLFTIRASQPTEPLHTLHKPALCIVAQGRKQVMLGEQLFVYDPEKYLVISVDVPIVGNVTEASPERPYLCMRLDLDPAVIGALIMDAGLSHAAAAPSPSLALSPLQYQKQIRLQEARRLILSLGADAATAGHQVGYDSPSQFSREYRRLFGAPPVRDVARLRASPELALTA